MKTLSGNKIVMIVAYRDFRDEEFDKPFAALTEAGASVTVASSQRGTAIGMLGKHVEVNRLIGDIAASSFDAVVFIGGAGAKEYFDDPLAHRIARDAVAMGKPLGAICIAPAILANAGVLKGKQAACFPSVTPILEKAGALVQKKPVVRDGKLFTADGPQSAGSFAAALFEALALRP